MAVLVIVLIGMGLPTAVAQESADDSVDIESDEIEVEHDDDSAEVETDDVDRGFY